MKTSNMQDEHSMTIDSCAYHVNPISLAERKMHTKA